MEDTLGGDKHIYMLQVCDVLILVLMEDTLGAMVISSLAMATRS